MLSISGLINYPTVITLAYKKMWYEYQPECGTKMLSIKVNNQSKVSEKNEKAKTISSDYPSNGIKNRYRIKVNSYSIIYTHLHGCGSGQVQQAIYALQTAQRINTKTLCVRRETWTKSLFHN
ncbi:hypothetical protein DET47_12313 [Shewanella putrefaciens]|nr:hypothetical protein DET47_12313 [Shewanella putrefaciens]